MFSSWFLPKAKSRTAAPLSRENAQWFRWPSLRAPIDILFLVVCVGLSVYVLAPELWGSGKSKDYQLWFWAGQQVLQGKDLYPNGNFKFIYPPVAAVLLALPSYFGKIPLYVGLLLGNAASWWVTGMLANAMSGSDEVPRPWLAALPAFATLSFTVEIFDLGQPNLFLLALMLFAFLMLQRQHPLAAGGFFALATAIKAFPVAVLPYLLWRRRWEAAASMIVFLCFLLFIVPAPIRGFQRNLAEVETWFHGMVVANSEKGFGQRDEQNWSWINQSIIAVTHRLTRPVDYKQDRGPPAYMNVVTLDFRAANWVLVTVCCLIGLAFVAVIPPRSKITRLSNAEELGILFCLMTISSPLARHYYFIWLYFPVTVLLHRAAFDPRPAARTANWLVLAGAGGLVALSIPVFPLYFQALGNYLAATFTLMAGLAWNIRHPPPALDPKKAEASLDELAS